jgi:predicted transcriptional regulator
MRPTFIGPLQLAVLAILWRDGPSSVRDLYNELAAIRPIAYTTLLSAIDRLAERGILGSIGRRANADIYMALCSRTDIVRMAVEQALAEVRATPAERREALDALRAAPQSSS